MIRMVNRGPILTYEFMLSQFLVVLIIVFLLIWLVTMLLSKNFWKRVGGHVVDGVAKKISGAIIFLIVLSVAALIASMQHR